MKKKEIQKIDALLTEIIEKAKEVKSLLNDEDKAASEEVLGKTSDVKALLKKHGSNKLSEVNPDDYEELLKEAEGL